jgi:hypothetical protein
LKLIYFQLSLTNLVYSLSLYYLGTNPISTKVPEKESHHPAFSLEKHNNIFGFSILIITHITGTLIFNLMQPTAGSKYFSQFAENNVSSENNRGQNVHKQIN